LNIPIFQIDAFTGKLFSGNPAAVCPLKGWLNEKLMQLIARENNLSETAFFVPEGDGFSLRWFTPLAEVDLCGHATLATAFVIFTEHDQRRQKVSFSSRSGLLSVERTGDMLSMNFPSQPPVTCVPPRELLEGLGKEPVQVLKSSDYFVVFNHEDDIRELSPRMDLLKMVDLRGVIVTAKGISSDFVSRFFAPGLGIDEDPVTGSAHCALTPYWSGRLGKKNLHALQLSKRGGELFCTQKGDRVIIAGHAVKYMEGTITIE
jgi:PhzF family phenazine biosynthesis protein